MRVSDGEAVSAAAASIQLLQQPRLLPRRLRLTTDSSCNAGVPAVPATPSASTTALRQVRIRRDTFQRSKIPKHRLPDQAFAGETVERPDLE
jgi:hypothetical protein